MCAQNAHLSWSHARGLCECGNRIEVDQTLVYYTASECLEEISEVTARDNQAVGYLQHSKFPIQIFRVKQFLSGLPRLAKERPVFELGCGPGPFTQMLLEQGYQVVAVDFSERSLLINRDANTAFGSKVCYVKADLNSLLMARESTNLLLMCDFLQHLGAYHKRNAFLAKAFEWLAPGGSFYLTFFNFNIKNYLKGDLHGSFAGGAITYERLLYKEVLRALPRNIKVDWVVPLNIFHSVVSDRLASGLPGAKYVARMMGISGRKVSVPMNTGRRSFASFFCHCPDDI